MSSVEPVRRLPNLVDIGADQLATRDSAAAELARVLSLRGYERIETPLLEQAELFVRKSGGELSSRLYAFVEPGGHRVGLRPELTAPVLRHAIETSGELGWPRRYQYAGPVFRYAAPEEPDGDKTRQFTQLGAEIIGSASATADGEIIAAAIEGLEAVGVAKPVAVIGHVGILWELLKPFGLSDRARLFLVNSVGQLRKGGDAAAEVRAEAGRLGLTGAAADISAGPVLPSGASLTDVAAVIDATIGPIDANAGVRTRAEIVERLARKQMTTSDPASFSRAFEFISELSTISGPPDAAIQAAEKVVQKAGCAKDALNPLGQVIKAAKSEGVDAASLAIDLGLARGIAYYTGMVFDLHSGDSQRDSLGGGGRYDGLTRALGAAEDVPALGFAYNLEAVLDVTKSSFSKGPAEESVLVAPADSNAIDAAVKEAARSRAAGAVAILDTESRDAAGRRAYAAEVGASAVVTVSAEGMVKREAVK